VLREQCLGVHWELNTSRLWGLRALLYLGEYAEVNSRAPAILDECRQRDDLYGEVSLSASVHCLALLGQGHSSEALRAVEAAEQRWSPQGFHLQHYYFLIAKASVALHERRIGDAVVFANQLGEGLERSLLKRIQMCRVNVHGLCGRVAMLSASGSAHKREWLRKVAHFSRLLRRERVDWATPQADLLDAALAMQAGNSAHAAELVNTALGGFENVEMRLHAACARMRLGALVGGDAGRALTVQARAFFELQQIDAERVIETLTPGLDS
jgi:hypothetical protein